MQYFILISVLVVSCSILKVHGICEKLPELIGKLGGKKPAKSDIPPLIIDACGDGYNPKDREFPFNLMEHLTGIQLNFGKADVGKEVTSWVEYQSFRDADITDIRKQLNKLFTTHVFTLRHYTSGKYPSVASNFALWKDGVIKAKDSHTNGKDWLQLGNTAFTFWLFCIDGEAPNRRFLNGLKVYDEIQLNEETMQRRGLQNVEFFASADLMEKQDLPKEVLLRGKVKDAAEVIFGYFLKVLKMKIQLNNCDDPKELLKKIDTEFSSFEIKIPGTVENPEWKDV